MARTKNLPIYGALGVAGGGTQVELKVFDWNLTNDNRVEFSGKIIGNLEPDTSPFNYVGDVVVVIDVPVFTLFQAEEEATGVVTSSFADATLGEIIANVGQNKINVQFYNRSNTVGSFQVSFSGSYKVTSDV